MAINEIGLFANTTLDERGRRIFGNLDERGLSIKYGNAIVSDSFNRTASTTNLGSTDSAFGGTSKPWQVKGASVYGINSSGQAYVSTTAPTRTIAVVDTGYSDGKVSMKFVSFTGSDTPKLVMRAIDQDNCVQLQVNFNHDGLTGFELYYYENGVNTNILGDSVTQIPQGSTVSVEVIGSNYNIYVNNSLVGTATCSKFLTATSFGFNAYNYPSSKFDDFKFEAPPTLVTNGLVGYWNSKQGVISQTDLGQVDFDTNISTYTRGQLYNFTVSTTHRTAFDSMNVQVGDYITNNSVLSDVFATIESINGYVLTARARQNATDGSPSQWAGEHIVRNTWSNLAPTTSTKYKAIISGSTVDSTGMKFNGSNNVVHFPKIDELQTANGDYSFEFRMNLSSYSGQDIFVTSENRTIYYPTNTGHTVRVYNASDTTRDGEMFSGTITNNTEYYISFTFNNTSKLGSLYVNGSLLSTITYPTGFGAFLPSMEFLNIGSTSAPPNGYIDNIRLYNKELTSSEVSQNYNVKSNVGLPPASSGTIDAGTFSFTGDTVLTAIGNGIFIGGSTFTGDSTLTPDGSILLIQPSTTSISGDTTLTSVGAILLNADTTITGDTTLTSIGSLILGGLSSLSGDTDLSSDGTILSTSVSADLTAISDVVAIGSSILRSDSTISAISDLIPNGGILFNADSSFVADGTLSGIPSIVLNALSSLNADTLLDVDGNVLTLSITANLGANGDLNSIGSIVFNGSADLTNSSVLTATGSLASDVVLVDMIHLKGSRELTIKLTGTRETIINLIGQRELNVKLKGEI